MTDTKADFDRSAMLKIGRGFAVWFSPINGKENVGDFLTLYFLNKLFEGVRVQADVYRLIGSVITAGFIAHGVENVARRNDARVAFWGCGCRDEKAIPAGLLAHASFMGVRGPLTRSRLGLPADTPLGDPAFVLPLLYSPRASGRSLKKTILVPHILDILNEPHDRLLRDAQADLLVSPVIDNNLDAVERFIDDICSAGFVMTGSLHGAIIACAYGIPFSFFDTGYVDHPFKWRDFSASIDVEARFPRKRAEAESVYESVLAGRMRRPPLAPLLKVAPLLVRNDVMARAQSHSWADGAAISAFGRGSGTGR